MASKKMYFSFSRQENLTASDIIEYFEEVAFRVERVRLYAHSARSYGIIYFRQTIYNAHLFQELHQIRGVVTKFVDRPNIYHRVLESGEEFNGTSILWLNDYCLQKIFSYLETEDLCNAADVCLRFKANAQSQFGYQRKSLEWDGELMECDDSDLLQFSRILQRFGASIKSLQISFVTNLDDFLKLVMLHCGPALSTLMLKDCILPEENSIPNVCAVFSHLRHLLIENGSNWFIKFLPFCSKLEQLELLDIFSFHTHADDDATYFFSFHQHYPKLTKASLNYIEHMSTNHIVNFLKMNPQLKTLELPINEIILKAIVKHVPNAEDIGFDAGDVTSIDILMRLRALRKVRITDFGNRHSHIVSSAINVLATGNMAIECLSFTEVSLTEEDVDGICKLVNIKTLHFVDYAMIEFKQLKQLCDHLKNLEELDIRNSFMMTLDEVVKLIRCNKKLILLQIEGVTIDIETFKQILDIVTQREQKIPLEIRLHNAHRSIDTKLANELAQQHTNLLFIREYTYHVVEYTGIY